MIVDLNYVKKPIYLASFVLSFVFGLMTVFSNYKYGKLIEQTILFENNGFTNTYTSDQILEIMSGGSVLIMSYPLVALLSICFFSLSYLFINFFLYGLRNYFYLIRNKSFLNFDKTLIPPVEIAKKKRSK